MSNKKGRLEKYRVDIINEETTMPNTPLRYQVQWLYRGKAVFPPTKLHGEEAVVDLLLRFKADCPKGTIEYGDGLEALARKVAAGYAPHITYDPTIP